MTASLAERVRAGERRALAQAITLVESTRADHRREAESLLDALVADTGRARRFGITGTPGAGKSTLIEALGTHVVEQGESLAVLAVDPSSRRSGGSILGDKTRMSELGRNERVFIRPSPAGTTLGGVARRTREAMLLCEAAGFDVVMIETVGVGQSEVAVADLVDLFVLITAPAAGDELQGIKRGIMELADVIVVNKADGDLRPAASRSCADLHHAVHLLRPKRPGWEIPVLACSALEGTGIPELWSTLSTLHDRLRADGLEDLRGRQRTSWLWSELTEQLVERLRRDPAVARLLPGVERDVAAGSLAVATAVRHLLDAFASSDPDQAGQTTSAPGAIE